MKWAFHHILVCPDDTILYGFFFKVVGYVDLHLLFGSRSSLFMFNPFAEALHWISEHLGASLDHFLNKFSAHKDQIPLLQQSATNTFYAQCALL
jgi:hypothetical protein